MSGIHRQIEKMTILQKIIWVLVGLCFIYGLYQAVSLAWVGDDAFISFRYAKNLVEGKGLVFNEGERVEGYTNFLWTMIIAAGMLLRFEPILFSWILGIISYLCIAFVLCRLSYKFVTRDAKQKVIIFPLSAMAVLVQYDFHVYATSGLETAFAAALVTLAFYVLVSGNSYRSFFWAGFILIMSVLSRPDAAIFYLMAIPYMLAFKSLRKAVILYLIPALIVYLPYWLMKYSYYGYPFPNTYYAKSAFLANYSQGMDYMMLYFKTYYILFLLPVILIITICHLVQRFTTLQTTDNTLNRTRLLAILMVVPFIIYVVRIGGDFMAARFFIPVTPLIFLLFETSLVSFERKTAFRLGLGVAILASLVLRWNQFEPPEKIINGITDERAYYPGEYVENSQKWGALLKRLTDEIDVTVGFYGGYAMLVYYSEFPLAIECDAGLNDEYIAHLPIEARGRPGHEKNAPFDYLLERRVNFIFKPMFTSRGMFDDIRWIYFHDLPAFLIIYENNLMEHFKKFAGIKFVDFPIFFDRYIQTVDSIPEFREPGDIDFFKMYYFDHNNDPGRLHKFADFNRSYGSN